LFELARVLVRLNHIAGRAWLAIPQPTEWQRIGNQIYAAMIFAGTDFVNVRWLHIFHEKAFKLKMKFISLLP
jgi:hypothetical protein